MFPWLELHVAVGPASALDVGLGGKVGGIGVGANAGLGGGKGQSKGARNTIVALPGALRPPSRIVLPRNLGPSGRSTSARGTWGYPLLPKIVRKPGTPDAVVRVCRQAIFSAATLRCTWASLRGQFIRPEPSGKREWFHAGGGLLWTLHRPWTRKISNTSGNSRTVMSG